MKTPGQQHQGTDDFAFIKTNIEIKWHDNAVSVISYFHPSRSYVYFDDLENEALLTHELYHFHITELFARKIRKKISDMRDKSDKSQINELYWLLLKEEDSMQLNYDYETNHSQLLGKQLNWQKKIDSLLLNLGLFEKTLVEF
ncbi:MAG: hypothetical protein KI790_00580 [Cyclobacteriaceae bacterium]|nr:hypothetical protein [Cyclobacteriaceae bacterium HetDA_MAG_MS6]